LRMATRSQQQRGHRNKWKSPSSDYRGVSATSRGGTWQATICIDGKQRSLGTFKKPTEAARTYDAAAVANGYLREALNFPGEHSI
jgi:hypothetical protein